MVQLDYRDEAIKLIDDGVVDAREIAIMAVKYMSMDEVKDMLNENALAPLTKEQLNYIIYDDPVFKSLFDEE
tara:strand:- start:1262 stop:1477 length:216 start_codon:yes stop_codon:yes gene_type:complete